MLKKIKTQREIDRKNKQKQIIVGVILIGLMVVSTAGFALTRGSNNRGKDNSKVDEKGLTFHKQKGIWTTSIDGKMFGFRYLPSEVSNVSVNGSYDLGKYSNQLLYYTDASRGAIEILSNIGNYALRYQGACLNESSCEGDLPVKDCTSNLFITESGNETAVYNDENCVYLVGDSLRAADAFLYKVLKV